MSRSRWLSSALAACLLLAAGVAGSVASPATARQVSAPAAPVTAARSQPLAARLAAVSALPATGRLAAGVVVAERRNDDRDRDRRRCQYPPSRTPSISLSGPNTVRRNEPADLTGDVSLNRCPLAGATVALYTSDDGVNWAPNAQHPVRTTTTRQNGSYAFRVFDQATHYYRAVVLATATSDAAISNQIRVTRR